MRNLVLFAFCVTVVFFQLSVEGVFFAERRIPDLALALVITLVLALKFRASFKWILFMGFLIDAGSGGIFGTTALAYFLIGWAVSRFVVIADIRSRKAFFLATLAGAVFISEIIKDLFFLAGLKMRANYLNESLAASLNFLSVDYIFKIAYSMLAAFVIYYLFRRTSRALFLEPVRLVKKY